MNLQNFKDSSLYQCNPYISKDTPLDMIRDINNSSLIHPEQDLVRFYLSIQIIGEIENKYGLHTDLPDSVLELVEQCHRNLDTVFMNMFSYLLLISIGEARHGNISKKLNKIESLFNKQISDFAKTIKGKNRATSRGSFLSMPRNLTQYLEYTVWCFSNCFTCDSFGGEKWATIATNALSVLRGEISPYTMVDFSWALVHNSGSIFNKGTIYTTAHNTSGLEQLLDIQRAGAIAFWVSNSTYYKGDSTYKTPAIDNKPLLNKALSILGDDLIKPITKYQVKEAGALNHFFKSLKLKETQGAVLDDANIYSKAGMLTVIPNTISFQKYTRS